MTWKVETEDRPAERELGEIERLLKEILSAIRGEATSFQIIQIDSGGNMINGINPGNALTEGNFALTLLPAGSTMPTGSVPQWVSDNPLAVVTPSPDGTTAHVAVDASFPPATSFNLTVNGTNAAGAPVTSGPVSIPVPLAGGTVGQATSFGINQVS